MQLVPNDSTFQVEEDVKKNPSKVHVSVYPVRGESGGLRIVHVRKHCIARVRLAARMPFDSIIFAFSVEKTRFPWVSGIR